MRKLVRPLIPLLFCCAFPFSAQAIPLGEVQGRSERSPLVGERVVVEGVITAVVEGTRRGWFLEGLSDGDPATSDALFVQADDAVLHNPSFGVGASVGVIGTVVELDAGRGTLTTLRSADISLKKTSIALPRPIRLAALPHDWERYEGMRLRIVMPLTVAGTHRAQRYGELLVNVGERLRAPTEVAAPGAATKALAAENAKRLLRLDDRSDAEGASAPWYLPNGLPRTGSRLSRVEGVVDQRDGNYRLQLTVPPKIREAPRPRAPNVGGDLRVVAFNLENLFNGDGRGGGFPTPRGARTPADYQAQLARHLATIRALKPDVLALMELENDGYGPDSSIATLVAAMRAAGLGEDWRFVDAGEGPGSDQIRVALLYRSDRVTPVGTPAMLTGEPFDRYSRAPLAQSFRAGSGPVFTIAVNHFKSKGCGNATGPDSDQSDGQGCWNQTRLDSARRVDAWLRSDPTRSGSDLAMIVGDLNAYAMEDPVQALIGLDWHDAYAGHGDDAYSYVFDSQTGRLDHALLSASLARRLAGSAKWHSNADEPARQETDGASTQGPWRSSDHDPLLLGFRLRR